MFPALTRVHDDHPLTAMTVDKVESVGKHLLMHFSGGLVLRTHMRMNGSWHIYRPGERWRQRARDMRVLVATADFEAVGFNIPVAEFIEGSDLERHEALARLGPDALGTSFDRDEAVRRLRAQTVFTIAEALLNQRLLAGLGNVYKSEALSRAASTLSSALPSLTISNSNDLVDTGRRLLQVNVGRHRRRASRSHSGQRRTTGRDNPNERLWVYGRARLPCRDAARRSKSGNTDSMRG